VFENEHGCVVSQKLISLPLPLSLLGPAAIVQSPPHTSATVVRRDILLKAGMFNTRLRYAEDKLLFMKVSCLGQWGRPETAHVIYRNKVKTIVSGQLSNRPHRFSRIRYARLFEIGIKEMSRIADSRFLAGAGVVMWKGWHRAGREWDKLGRPAIAVMYYCRALKYGVHSKTLGRIVAACLKRTFSC